MSISRRTWFFAGALALLLQCGCGGSTPGAEQPGDRSEGGETVGDGTSGEPGSLSGGEASDPCADGSCVTCGEGVCPTGYFCNESAAGGAGCGWLAECADSATCACVQQALGAGCECNERGGFPVVSCN